MTLVELMLISSMAGHPLGDVLSHPPRDLASLLAPAAVLQKLEVKTTEDALFDVLKAKADAAPADADAGDMLYVKKLMAIRLLEQNKSQNALPVLEQVVKETDITLRDAAKEAIAAISGKPSPRPSGAALLKELAQHLPGDAGFVIALDMERESRTTPIRALMEIAMQDTEAKGVLAPPPGSNMAPEEAAQMKAQMKAQFQAITGPAEDGLIHALAQTGNMRIDAALIVFSSDVGVAPERGYVGYVCKGLYDPERVGRLLKKGPYEESDIGGRKVYSRAHGPQICLCDANTLVDVTPFRGTETTHIEKMLDALTATGKPPQKALATAFDLVTEKKARAAASGSLSPAQKVSVRASLGEEPHRIPVVETMRQTALKIVSADSYIAAIDDKGNLSLQVVCADNASATSLSDAANTCRQLLQDELRKGPPPFFSKAFFDEALWQADLAENTVTMKMNGLRTLSAAPRVLVLILLPGID